MNLESKFEHVKRPNMASLPTVRSGATNSRSRRRYDFDHAGYADSGDAEDEDEMGENPSLYGPR